MARINFYAETLAMLRASNISREIIARKIGVSIRWLNRLEREEFSDPGVTKIERLHEYLTTMERQRRRVS